MANPDGQSDAGDRWLTERKPHDATSGPDDAVAALVEEYFERTEAGEPLTPASFAAEHPESAAALRPFLDGLSLLDRVRKSHADGLTQSDGPAEAANMPRIEGYRLLEEIGRGGMGVVYRARQHSTDRVVAVKVMLAGGFASPLARQRFEREITLAARLQHPVIVRVLESGLTSNLPYYTMDYIEGLPLDRHLAIGRPDTADVLQLFQRLCDGVDYAHAHGVIHRDLKPANVLVDAEGEPHILDFGLAKAVEPADGAAPLTTCLTTLGQPMGTLPYLSPEQARGDAKSVGPWTDVYALGTMLFEALTGRTPFDSTGAPAEVLRRIVEDAPPVPSAHSKRVVREVETIILKALEKDPHRRYADAGDLAADLGRYLDGEPITAGRPSRLYRLRKRIAKQRVALGLGMAAVALGVLSVTGGIRWSRHTVERQRTGGLAAARLAVMHAQRGLESGRGMEAIASAVVVARDYPELRETQLVLAQAHFRDDIVRPSALRTLEGQLSRDPSRWACRALLVEMYRAIGNHGRADELEASATGNRADTAEDWYVRSFATLDVHRALRCTEEALDRAPDHALARERATNLYLHTGRFDEAIRAAERMIALGHDPAAWTEFKGSVLARAGRFREAIAEYSRVIQLSPDRSGGYRMRAHAHRRVGAYSEAVEDYTTALRLDGVTSGNIWDHYQRATALWILGRREEAARDLRRVRALRGEPFYCDARLFLILREQGRDADAQAVLEAALKEVKDRWLDRIFTCLAERITPAQLVEAAGDDPEHRCEACYYAGEACLLVGRPDEAHRWFERCIRSGVAFDLDTFPLSPMNEYELAAWRLRQLSPSSKTSESAQEN